MRYRKALEGEFSAHLEKTRLVVGGDLAERTAVDVGADCVEVGMVGNIEGLDAQLELYILADVGVLGQSNVPFLEARSVERACACVAELIVSRPGVGRLREPLSRLLEHLHGSDLFQSGLLVAIGCVANT